MLHYSFSRSKYFHYCLAPIYLLLDYEIDGKINVTAILFLLVQNRHQTYGWTLIGSGANGLGIQEWLYSSKMYSATVVSQLNSKALPHFKVNPILKIDATFHVCLDHCGVLTENGKLILSKQGLFWWSLERV